MIALLNHHKFKCKVAEKGVGQKEVAEELGISDRYVRVLCKKDKKISLPLYYKICVFFETSWDEMWILVDEDE